MASANPLVLGTFCRAARNIGFQVSKPQDDGPVIAQRGDQRLEANIRPDGTLAISGKGSYMALTEMFPTPPKLYSKTGR